MPTLGRPQEKIKKKLEKLLNLMADITQGGANQNEDQNSETLMNYGFRIEYCKDQETKCKECKQHIEKGKIQVFDTIYGHITTSSCYHLDCFIEVCEILGFHISDETLEGIERLTDSDQSGVKDALAKKLKQATIPKKCILPKIELNDEELEVKKVQDKRMNECRDELAELHSTWTYRKLLKKNGQNFEFDSEIKSGSMQSREVTDLMLDRLADAMTFGALERCPNCEKGQLEFRSYFSEMSYYCTGENEWGRCGSYFDDPPRRPFVVPNKVKKNVQDIEMKMFWEKYDNAKIEKRVFERNPPSLSTNAMNQGHRLKYPKDKTEFPSICEYILFPQSTQEREKNVHIDQNGNYYSASLVLTDLQRGKNSYCIIQVLKFNGPIKGYKYSFSQSWGEIGMPGSTYTKLFALEHDAIRKFLREFYYQTKHLWIFRRSFEKFPGKKFFLDLFYGQHVAEDDETSKEPSPILEKSVQELVKLIFGRTLMADTARETEHDLLKMPLGKLTKKQILRGYEVLKELEDHVTKQENGVDQNIVLSLSNKFYTLIPHRFAAAVDYSSLILDTVPAIKKKLELLDSFMEMAKAYSRASAKSLMNLRYKELGTKLQSLNEANPVFKILENCVKKKDAKRRYIDKNEHRLDIVRIFKAERQGEKERSERFKTVSNKRLLWHGSRIDYFTEILSQGLRIDPWGLRGTRNLMFGDGIYFADMAYKAAYYCREKETLSNTGLLLLCEVTLGHMKHLFEANYDLKSPPRGYNSVKGVGHMEPRPRKTRALYDDVILASGSGVPTSVNRKLLPSSKPLTYNEYIVYDEAQVKIKYLLQVKFSYPYADPH